MKYERKLDDFRFKLESHWTGWEQRVNGATDVDVEFLVYPGYKYDKVYRVIDGENKALFMVDTRSGDIYGVKSWAQVNRRRWYGTLDTIDDWSWAPEPTPKVGTKSEAKLYTREQDIKKSYKKRGRPPKISKLKVKE